MYVVPWETTLARVVLIHTIAHPQPTNITQDRIYTDYDMLG